MAEHIDALTASVSNMEAGVASAVVAFKSLADQIAESAGDRAATLALAVKLDASAGTLAAAVMNPGGTPPPPEEPPIDPATGLRRRR